MEQVWFCGMHTDVGGGYKEQELSDIPLKWLMDEAVKKGLLIYPKHEVNMHPDSNGKMHDSRGSKLARLYKRKTRHWDLAKHGKPVVHHSVLKRSRNRLNEESGYEPWILQTDFDEWTESP